MAFSAGLKGLVSEGLCEALYDMAGGQFIACSTGSKSTNLLFLLGKSGDVLFDLV